MLTRRRFLGYTALTPAMLACHPLLRAGAAQERSESTEPPLRLAVIGSTYHLGSDMQTIADRFLVGYPHEGDWHIPNVQIVSMYVESQQRDPEFAAPAPPHRTHIASDSQEDWHPKVAQNVQPPPPAEVHAAAPASEESGPMADLSAARSSEFGFRLCANIPEALRCGGDHLAVDAVLAIVEQVGYPRNDRGQILYPRYDFFQQCVEVFEDEGRAVPYFNHESLSFSFNEAQSMVATSERLKFPLLAGSSLPVTWRMPDVDIPLDAHIEEAVMVGMGPLDGKDFDALEAMQCMLERRKGGETGVKAVQLLEGDDVWAAGDSGRWSKELLSSALSRSDAIFGLTMLDGRPQDLVAAGVLPQLVKDPAAYCIEYNDGTRATLLMLTGASGDFTFAARLAGAESISTQFFRSPAPNNTFSACLAAKIEHMFTARAAPYPVRRTMLTSGLLEAGLLSRRRLNDKIETPHLAAVKYDPPAESQYARA
jgi:hypothetical protein